jgi:hypothetical protein
MVRNEGHPYSSLATCLPGGSISETFGREKFNPHPDERGTLQRRAEKCLLKTLTVGRGASNLRLRRFVFVGVHGNPLVRKPADLPKPTAAIVASDRNQEERQWKRQGSIAAFAFPNM